MDSAWIGRRLMVASKALTERYAANEPAAGTAAPIVSGVAAALLREIGRSIALEETEARLPFARTRGVLRMPTATAQAAFAQAFNALAALVQEYLRQLPGVQEAHLRQSRAAIAHAARSTMFLHRTLVAGEREPAAEQLFGGVALLVFPRPAVDEAALAAP